jgi:hypothetical protein
VAVLAGITFTLIGSLRFAYMNGIPVMNPAAAPDARRRELAKRIAVAGAIVLVAAAGVYIAIAVAASSDSG